MVIDFINLICELHSQNPCILSISRWDTSSLQIPLASVRTNKGRRPVAHCQKCSV